MVTLNSSEREPFERARAWLLRAGERAGAAGATRLHVHLNIAVGLDICNTVAPPAASALRQGRAFLGRLRRRLHADTTRGRFDPTALDTKLLLLGVGILRRQGLRVPGVDSFLDDVAAAINGLEKVPRHLSGEAVLLAGLGWCERPPAHGLSQADLGSPSDLLLADAEAIRTRCNSIAAGTQFGLSTPSRRGRTARHLADVLTVVVLHGLREYDLTLAATVLRTVGYLGMAGGGSVSHAVEYLRNQQQDDGRFGHFASIGPALARQSDVELDLYVPVTVSCLWTISELTLDGFRLFRRASEDLAGTGFVPYPDASA